MANVGVGELEWTASLGDMGSGKMFRANSGDSGKSNMECAMDSSSRFAICKHGTDLSMSGLRDGLHGRVMVEVEVEVGSLHLI